MDGAHYRKFNITINIYIIRMEVSRNTHTCSIATRTVTSTVITMPHHIKESGNFFITAMNIDKQLIFVLCSHILNFWKIDGVSGRQILKIDDVLRGRTRRNGNA